MSLDHLKKLKPRYIQNGYPVPKWIKFCETMIKHGWRVKVYQAYKTVSKYIYIRKGKFEYKVRFSNHMPAEDSDNFERSDFYVGISRGGKINTESLIEKLLGCDNMILMKCPNCRHHEFAHDEDIEDGIGCPHCRECYLEDPEYFRVDTAPP